MILHQVLFEALNMCIHIDEFCSEENMRAACRLLGTFVSAKE